MTWSSKETACGQVKPLSMFAPVLFSGLKWSTCLEPSSVASCNGELVAPLGIAHVWHESVVEGITWQEDTLINSNVTEKKMSKESPTWIIEQEKITQKLHLFLTRNLKISPFLWRATEVMNVLEEITAARHDEFITAFLCVAAGVKFYRQVDGPRNMHLVLKEKESATWQTYKWVLS